jgi:hypothetical protein
VDLIVGKSSTHWGNDTATENQLEVSSKQLLTACFTLVSCLAYPSTLKIEATRSSEKSAAFNGLYGIISQNMKLFNLESYTVKILDEPAVALDQIKVKSL